MRRIAARRGIIIGVMACSLAWAGPGHDSGHHYEGQPGMPRIQPEKSYSVSSDEQGERLLQERGYGDEEARVGMMYQMMVGGSGMEGMEMRTSGESSGHH